MGSIGNPRTWVPYTNTKDCSQGFCSLYCPQWCYIIFPPPPPIEIADDDSSGGPNFSPLVIAIIGVLASAFLLVSYYTIISKYCGKGDSTRRRSSENYVTDVEVMEDNDNHNPSGHDHDAWRGSSNGLDEALIKSITVFKYKKGDGTDDGGLIEVTDCSVCLSEFVEDESLRLLPKCSHAFHVQCIDTWLKSHSNCPLCRANIISVPTTSAPPVPVTETTPGDEQPSNNENLSRAISDLSNPQGRDHVVIDIREGSNYDHQEMIMRRSVSMDHFGETRGPVVDISHTNREGMAGSSKQWGEGGSCKGSSNRMSVLNCVMNPDAMKRSFSSGRLFLTRQGRVRDLSIPL